jgi:ketosteroid isomerase-like protein
MTEQERNNRKLGAKLLECYAKNDHDGIIDLVTSDCVFMIGAGKSQGVVPYHGMHTGHEKIRGYLRKRHANSTRDECLIKPQAQPAAASPKAPDEPDEQSDQQKLPLHERFIVQGNVVVAIGRLKDKFADGRDMHETDFVIVFHVDEEQEKISSFQYFFDTEGAAHAWRKSGRHQAH